MSDPAPRRPASLAELRAGDEVIEFDAHGWRRITVTRVTPARIFCGTTQFRRSARYETQIGGSIGSYLRSDIDVGPQAEKRAAEYERSNARRAEAMQFRAGAFNATYSQKGIRAVRAACDVAEAALREAGEWSDE